MNRPTRPAITPETKVGDLLAAYPELEPVLIAQAPAFANLRNPILRKTVARVATLAAAARVGGLEPRSLVRALRTAAGQDAGEAAPGQGETGEALRRPDWYHEDLVVERVEADLVLARGDHPLGVISQATRRLTGPHILAIDSTFLPAPLIDALRQQGFEVQSFQAGPAAYRTCVRRGLALGGDRSLAPPGCGR